MILSEARKIVEENSKVQEDSFFWLLHERDQYDVSKFELFIQALNTMNENAEMSKIQIKEIIHLYSYFHRAIIYSMDYADHAELKLPDVWREHLEEFDLAVNRLFN